MSTGSLRVDAILERMAALAPPLPADKYAAVTAILRRHPPRLPQPGEHDTRTEYQHPERAA